MILKKDIVNAGLLPVQWGIKEFEGCIFLAPYFAEMIAIVLHTENETVKAFKFYLNELYTNYVTGPVDFPGEPGVWNGNKKTGEPYAHEAEPLYIAHASTLRDIKNCIAYIEKHHIQP
jgi:hypothetical protein